MSIIYNKEHSINIWKSDGVNSVKKNTWIDFHLVPVKRPHVNAPNPVYHIVAIPGTNIRRDITDYLPGGLTFEKRSGEWEFYVEHDGWSGWEKAFNDISDFVHGSYVTVQLADDPNYLYRGELIVSGYNAGDAYSSIKIEYDLDTRCYAAPGEIYPIKFIGIGKNVYADNYGVAAFANYKTILSTGGLELMFDELEVL